MLKNVHLPIFEANSMTLYYQEYTPVALLCHFGSLTTGHYMVLLKQPNHTWVAKDDSSPPHHMMSLPDYTSTATVVVFLAKVSAPEATSHQLENLIRMLRS